MFNCVGNKTAKTSVVDLNYPTGPDITKTFGSKVNARAKTTSSASGSNKKSWILADLDHDSSQFDMSNNLTFSLIKLN
jgi:hypothetical protein